VFFLGVVVLVCACSDIELITSIAAMVARSCFVMDPRKIWKAQGQQENQSGREAHPDLPPFAL
jgi:hypothetical protein